MVKGGRLYEPGDIVPGHAVVVSRFLRTGYLWDTVRVMGGAYGGFTKFDPVSGVFSCLSYRDPNLAKTLDNYDGCSGKWSASYTSYTSRCGRAQSVRGLDPCQMLRVIIVARPFFFCKWDPSRFHATNSTMGVDSERFHLS